MKVLVNAISAKRGGIVTYTENLIDSLRARGIDALFAVPREIAVRHPAQAMAVAATDYRPVQRLLWEQAVWRRFVKRLRPDVLFSSANFGLIGSPVPQILLLREGGLFDPFYLTDTAPSQGAATAVMRHIRRRMMLLSARHAEHVIVPSATMRDMLIGWSPDIADRCTVNPYGTPGKFYRPAERPRPWRADGVLRLLYVSVYYPHKNPAALCAAVERLNAAGFATHATITMDLAETRIPGGCLDRLALERAAQRGHVTLGHYDYRDLPALYRSHDVFVFPSVSETFGHPMAEALSMGLPIVAADTAINREICGDAALFFPPHSTGELVARLTALDADAALRESLRATAVRIAPSLYDWDKHVDRLAALFERTAASARKRAA